MSHANVEIARKLSDAVDSGGFEAVFAHAEELFHEDVEWIEDPSWPGGGTYRGPAAIRELISERTDSFDFEQHTEKLIDAGDDVVPSYDGADADRSAAPRRR
jgi:ketosteroid isomerase-like protein